VKVVESHALLVRAVPYGETDLIVTLLTEAAGKVGARLRGGRRSSKRAAGGVEPFHTLGVALEDRGGELMTLKSTGIVTIREALVGSLEAMEAAGTALRWARHLFPTRQAEPRGWQTVVDLLDALEAEGGRPGRVKRILAVAGLELLASVGYALELERCVVCGRPCPPGAPAYVQPVRGGIVCRACGGGGRLLDARTRELAAEAQRGEGLAAVARVEAADAESLLGLVSDAMAAHAGLDPSK
jgi:DNA repair protein RecO (recombination protein O)